MPHGLKICELYKNSKASCPLYSTAFDCVIDAKTWKVQQQMEIPLCGRKRHARSKRRKSKPDSWENRWYPVAIYVYKVHVNSIRVSKKCKSWALTCSRHICVGNHVLPGP